MAPHGTTWHGMPHMAPLNEDSHSKEHIPNLTGTTATHWNCQLPLVLVLVLLSPVVSPNPPSW